MENIGKKRRRGGGAVTTASTTTTSGSVVGDPLKDLIFQFSDPPPTSTGPIPSHQQQLVDYPDTPGVSDTMMENSIQSSLDQLGSDISQIKTQLEKKKAKASLVDVSEKLDQIINYLMKGGSGSAGDENFN